MAKMRMNRLRNIIAEASEIIAEYDANRSAESGDDDAPAGPMGGAPKPTEDDEDAPAMDAMPESLLLPGGLDLREHFKSRAYAEKLATSIPGYDRLHKK